MTSAVLIWTCCGCSELPIQRTAIDMYRTLTAKIKTSDRQHNQFGGRCCNSSPQVLMLRLGGQRALRQQLADQPMTNTVIAACATVEWLDSTSRSTVRGAPANSADVVSRAYCLPCSACSWSCAGAATATYSITYIHAAPQPAVRSHGKRQMASVFYDAGREASVLKSLDAVTRSVPEYRHSVRRISVEIPDGHGTAPLSASTPRRRETEPP
jgi:hypothetical protein